MSRVKPTILCIDDHWNGLIRRKMFLEQNGYQVLEATNGPEGLELFASQPVDAVILDYQIPGMSGDVAYGPLPKAKLKKVDAFLSKMQPPMILLSTLQQMLDGAPKPFFYRWLYDWKQRAQGVRP
jgi:CheY-like chemotaxis protein